MVSKYNKMLNHFFRPYIFLLQEGETDKDSLDYTLKIFNLGSPEVLFSPERQAQKNIRIPLFSIEKGSDSEFSEISSGMQQSHM